MSRILGLLTHRQFGLTQTVTGGQFAQVVELLRGLELNAAEEDMNAVERKIQEDSTAVKATQEGAAVAKTSGVVSCSRMTSVWATPRSPTVSARDQVLRAEATALFAQADLDKNGTLSHSELKKQIQKDDALRERLSITEWKTFFSEIDSDGDGVITQE